MSRPLPLVIALLGLASAMAQEVATSLDSTPTTSATDDSKPSAKKTPAATEARKSAPLPAVAAEPTVTTGGKARRVTFVDHKAREASVPPPAQVDEQPERPRTFWERLFGRRKPRPTPPPTPEPVATPKPAVHVRKFVKTPPSSVSSAQPIVSATPTPKPRTTTPPAPKVAKMTEPAATKVPKVTENPSAEKPEKPAMTPADPVVLTPKPTPTPRATPAPKKTPKISATAIVPPAPTPARKAPIAPAADADAEAQEKYHYEVAKEKALQDPDVQKLKEKADGATSDDEAKKAQRAYNKALFNKMRSVDSSIKDRADRIEAAILKRLDSPE